MFDSSKTLLLPLTALCLTACGVVEAPITQDNETQTRKQAIITGAPIEGYPSYEERLVLYMTNQAKSEPEKFNAKEPFPPSPPVRYDKKLSEAARFHAAHIITDDCWCEDHSSCCPLEGMGDGVQCASASTGCGVTSTADRVSRWSPDYTAENMALGQRSAREAVDGWINSSGHWQNMNSSHGLLGVGHYDGAWVQDFGRPSGIPPIAEDGIHFSSGAATTFGITYYQPKSGGPQSALVVVDGECLELKPTVGTAEHGSFETNKSLPSGCSRYYFFIRDGNGADHFYPSEGSFGIATGVSADDCPFFSENRPADTCTPAGQSCETGDTRPCYTGPFGTKNKGICQEGTERCIGGKWNGMCRNQVKPEEGEACGDNMDNDCDGDVDEDCASDEDASPDMSGMNMNTDPTPQQDDGGCQILKTSSSPPPFGWLLLFLFLSLPLTQRKRIESITS